MILNDDTTTLHTLRNFLSSAKPTSITPVDILLVAHLISRKAEDHPIYDSQQTLARMCNVNWRTIQRSLERLASKEIDWISSPQRRGKTNALSLKYMNIPAEDTLRLKLTADAKQVAFRYQQAMKKFGRMKFPAQWLAQQFVSAQRILNACNGDMELAAQIVNHAINHQKYGQRSRQSLYHLYGLWPKVLTSYTEKLQARERQRAQQAAEAMK